MAHPESQHLALLQRCCRLCGIQTSKQLHPLIPFNSFIKKELNIDLSRDNMSVHPSRMCSKCKVKLTSMIGSVNVKPFEFAEFSEHAPEGYCTVCNPPSKSTLNEEPKAKTVDEEQLSSSDSSSDCILQEDSTINSPRTSVSNSPAIDENSELLTSQDSNQSESTNDDQCIMSEVHEESSPVPSIEGLTVDGTEGKHASQCFNDSPRTSVSNYPAFDENSELLTSQSTNQSEPTDDDQCMTSEVHEQSSPVPSVDELAGDGSKGENVSESSSVKISSAQIETECAGETSSTHDEGSVAIVVQDHSCQAPPQKELLSNESKEENALRFFTITKSSPQLPPTDEPKSGHTTDEELEDQPSPMSSIEELIIDESQEDNDSAPLTNQDEDQSSPTNHVQNVSPDIEAQPSVEQTMDGTCSLNEAQQTSACRSSAVEKPSSHLTTEGSCRSSSAHGEQSMTSSIQASTNLTPEEPISEKAQGANTSKSACKKGSHQMTLTEPSAPSTVDRKNSPTPTFKKPMLPTVLKGNKEAVKPTSPKGKKSVGEQQPTLSQDLPRYRLLVNIDSQKGPLFILMNGAPVSIPETIPTPSKTVKRAPGVIPSTIPIPTRTIQRAPGVKPKTLSTPVKTVNRAPGVEPKTIPNPVKTMNRAPGVIAKISTNPKPLRPLAPKNDSDPSVSSPKRQKLFDTKKAEDPPPFDTTPPQKKASRIKDIEPGCLILRCPPSEKTSTPISMVSQKQGNQNNSGQSFLEECAKKMSLEWEATCKRKAAKSQTVEKSILKKDVNKSMGPIFIKLKEKPPNKPTERKRYAPRKRKNTSNPRQDCLIAQVYKKWLEGNQQNSVNEKLRLFKLQNRIDAQSNRLLIATPVPSKKQKLDSKSSTMDQLNSVLSSSGLCLLRPTSEPNGSSVVPPEAGKQQERVNDTNKGQSTLKKSASVTGQVVTGTCSSKGSPGLNKSSLQESPSVSQHAVKGVSKGSSDLNKCPQESPSAAQCPVKRVSIVLSDLNKSTPEESPSVKGHAEKGVLKDSSDLSSSQGSKKGTASFRSTFARASPLPQNILPKVGLKHLQRERYKAELYHQSRFVETQVAAILSCSFCHLVPRLSFTTSCNHIFCLMCGKAWFTETNNCCKCGAKISVEDIEELSGFAAAALQTLNLKCKNWHKGCKFTCRLVSDEIHTHESCCKPVLEHGKPMSMYQKYVLKPRQDAQKGPSLSKMRPFMQSLYTFCSENNERCADVLFAALKHVLHMEKNYYASKAVAAIWDDKDEKEQKRELLRARQENKQESVRQSAEDSEISTSKDQKSERKSSDKAKNQEKEPNGRQQELCEQPAVQSVENLEACSKIAQTVNVKKAQGANTSKSACKKGSHQITLTEPSAPSTVDRKNSPNVSVSSSVKISSAQIETECAGETSSTHDEGSVAIALQDHSYQAPPQKELLSNESKQEKGFVFFTMTKSSPQLQPTDEPKSGHTTDEELEDQPSPMSSIEELTIDESQEDNDSAPLSQDLPRYRLMVNIESQKGPLFILMNGAPVSIPENVKTGEKAKKPGQSPTKIDKERARQPVTESGSNEKSKSKSNKRCREESSEPKAKGKSLKPDAGSTPDNPTSKGNSKQVPHKQSEVKAHRNSMNAKKHSNSVDNSKAKAKKASREQQLPTEVQSEGKSTKSFVPDDISNGKGKTVSPTKSTSGQKSKESSTKVDGSHKEKKQPCQVPKAGGKSKEMSKKHSDQDPSEGHRSKKKNKKERKVLSMKLSKTGLKYRVLLK